MDLNKSNSNFNEQDIESNKWIALIAYLSILSLVTAIIAPNSKYARYHANQGICLLIAEVIFGIVKVLVCTILGWIPLFGWIVIIVFNLAGNLFLVLSVLGMVHVIRGEVKPIPIIGRFQILK